MRRFALITFAFLVLVAVFLAIPYLLRDTSSRSVVGPSLDELTYETVAFQNGDLDLAGLLFLPDGDAPFPGAVFIHGSGTSRRDNAWYLTFVQELQANGIAVLLPDKRGSEHSGGDWRDRSFEVLATDSDAAIDLMAEIADIDHDRIGLIGFSQGGFIAPVVASKRSDIAYVASISGSGVSTEEQLWFEEVNNIVEMGTYRFVARLVARFTVPSIQQRVTWRATAGFDPMDYWPEVEEPVFAALGGGDTNVPAEESARRLETLSGDVVVKIYPDGGHAIWDPETRRVQQALLDDLESFAEAARRD